MLGQRAVPFLVFWGNSIEPLFFNHIRKVQLFFKVTSEERFLHLSLFHSVLFLDIFSVSFYLCIKYIFPQRDLIFITLSYNKERLHYLWKDYLFKIMICFSLFLVLQIDLLSLSLSCHAHPAACTPLLKHQSYIIFIFKRKKMTHTNYKMNIIIGKNKK